MLAALAAVIAGGQPADAWIIETVVGYGPLGDGGPATAAQLNQPQGVALDGAGNLYIADSENDRIRKVDATGVISTVAGTGTAGYSGDGGPAVAAQLRSPYGVALDGAGNLYIADSGNERIRKVDAAGVISTVAGDGTRGFGGDGGPAVAAQLNFPQGVALDGAGNLYIADSVNDRIRKVDAAGVISTVAGDGTFGFGGDGGAAAAAQLNIPSGVALDGSGNLYIADRNNNRIRKVDAAGIISTVAGDGARGFGGDGGPATAAQLLSPSGVALDGSGNLYIADRNNNRIRKVDAAGVISTVAGDGARGFGGDGGPAAAAQLNIPEGVALDGSGNLYIAEWGNRIRKVDSAGVISTVAGGGSVGDGSAATAALLHTPRGVVVDGSGNLYIADTFNHRIRKVDAAGVISTVAGDGTEGFGGDGGPATAARLRYPRGVTPDDAGNLYIADTLNQRIRKVDATGTITTVAGSGGFGFGEGGYSGDGGPATAAQLYYPQGVALDGSGNLYIADTLNDRIRKVDAAGGISTVAGDGARGFGGDGGPATAAQLYIPTDVALDGSGNLYIADWANQRIRKVDTAGGISTVAGDGARGFGGDGGPATAARLGSPEGVALDGSGNLYIADRDNNRIRKVDAAGVISTVAGTGTAGYSGDGGPAVAAQLRSPNDVALDDAGNLYIADTNNHRIRKATAPAAIPLISSGGIVLATGTPVLKRISPNSLISVFGQNFAPEGTQALSPRLDAEGRVAANLAGTCLEIDGKRAPLFAVFTTQINAQAPSDLTPGQSRAVAIRGCDTEMEEQRGTVATVETVTVSPAFFSFQSNTDGRNPIIALHGDGPDLVGSPGAVPGVELTPAEPGEYISLFGTGFGTTEPQLETGQIPDGLARLANDVSFTFGGITVLQEDVFYAGAAPCCAGLYQFTVRVPLGFPDGHAPVVATVQGVSTPEGPYLTIRRPQ